MNLCPHVLGSYLLLVLSFVFFAFQFISDLDTCPERSRRDPQRNTKMPSRPKRVSPRTCAGGIPQRVHNTPNATRKCHPDQSGLAPGPVPGVFLNASRNTKMSSRAQSAAGGRSRGIWPPHTSTLPSVILNQVKSLDAPSAGISPSDKSNDLPATQD